ncbi:MAG: DUF697 domain-containing protein [Sphingobacteriales bacterium]|nr:DUF697 domain-containing protein [Sphingobacteriales bacterium]MCC7224561.1 DUF697 domain-containing protein [Chitinophagales bacterium]
MDKEQQHAQAQSIIRSQMYWCLGAGLIPLPLLDLTTVTMLQMDMLRQLCQLYGVSYDEAQGKARIIALAGGTLPRIAASLVKVIPFVGTIAGAVSESVLSAASAYAIGQVFTRHFEAGGTLQNFSALQFREIYAEMLEIGKSVAKKLAKK